MHSKAACVCASVRRASDVRRVLLKSVNTFAGEYRLPRLLSTLYGLFK